MYNRILAGSGRTLEMDSAALKGNPLGDPHIRRFPVYLPLWNMLVESTSR